MSTEAAADAPVEQPTAETAEQQVLQTDELLEELLAKLGPQSLKSASLVCKRWHRLAASKFDPLEQRFAAAADAELSTAAAPGTFLNLLDKAKNYFEFMNEKLQRHEVDVRIPTQLFEGALLPRERAGVERLISGYEHGLGAHVLGKSVSREPQVIAFLAHMLEHGVMGHLIITTKSSLQGWQDAFRGLAPAMRLLNLAADQDVTSAAQRKDSIRADKEGVVLTTYSLAVKDLDLLKKKRFGTVFFDEGFTEILPNVGRSGSNARKLWMGWGPIPSLSAVKYVLGGMRSHATMEDWCTALDMVHDFRFDFINHLLSSVAPLKHAYLLEFHGARILGTLEADGEPFDGVAFMRNALIRKYRKFLSLIGFLDLEDSPDEDGAAAGSSSAGAGPSSAGGAT